MGYYHNTPPKIMGSIIPKTRLFRLIYYYVLKIFSNLSLIFKNEIPILSLSPLYFSLWEIERACGVREMRRQGKGRKGVEMNLGNQG